MYIKPQYVKHLNKDRAHLWTTRRLIKNRTMGGHWPLVDVAMIFNN